MNDMTVAEFCERFDACTEGRQWADSTGLEMMSELWDRDDMRTEWRIWIATQAGVLSDRDARLFACWCARQVWHLMRDDRSKRVVEVAELYAIGNATKEDLDVALDAAEAARAAAWDAARAAARAAGLATAWAAEAARAAAWAARAAAWAARATGWAAARAAAWAAAEAAEAARAAAWEAAQVAQANRLVEMGNPFKKGE